MTIFIFWIVFSFIVAYYGGQRKIGSGAALFISLLLSPLVGAICVALSERIVILDTRVDDLVRKGNQEFINREYKKTLETLQQALKIDSNHKIIQYNLACTYSKLGDFELAILHLNKAIGLGYSNFENLLNDTDLAELRSSSEFQAFKSKGYKL